MSLFVEERPDAAPTPTRFLKECGEYLLTPGFGMFAEPNPFEVSFRTGMVPEPPSLIRSDSNLKTPTKDIRFKDSTRTTTVSVNRTSDKKTIENDQSQASMDIDKPRHTEKKVGSNSPSITAKDAETFPGSRLRRDSKMFDDNADTKGEDSDSGFSSSSYNCSSPPAAKADFNAFSEKRKSEDETDEASEKRRRFLERNRRAASKCRQKKKMWVQELESRSDEISNRNKALHHLTAQLKEEVMQLRGRLLAHQNCNCNVIQRYVQTSGHFLNPAARMHPPVLITSSIDPSAVSTAMPPSMMPQPIFISGPLNMASILTTANMPAPVIPTTTASMVAVPMTQ